MKNLEFVTAPVGTATSILAMTMPTMDDVQAFFLLMTAIVCGCRSIWIAVKPILKKIRDAWHNFKNRKNGGSDNEKME